MLTATDLRTVVGTAVTAPSVHNAQPWSFTATPTGLELLADTRRGLPRQDPDGRELLISCGAASLHAQLALRGLGLGCGLGLLPDDTRPDLVAVLTPSGSVPPTPAERRLLQAVPRRHTDRGPYADWPVPLEAVDALGAAADAEGAWLQVLSSVDVLELALWQAHAAAAVGADPDALAERASWARQDGDAADGVPGATVPGWPAGRRARDRHVPDDVVLVLGTDHDDRLSWVRAGRALDRLLLDATARGLVAAPATLALELPALRHGLTRALALRGAPQVVLRVGYPAGLGSPRSGRRPIGEVLVH